METESNTNGQAAQPLKSTSPAVRNMRLRLERWELRHLRELALAQHEQIERLTAELEETKRQLSWAEDCAEMWRNDALDAMEASLGDDPATHRCIGLSQSGHLMVVAMNQPGNGLVTDDHGNLVHVQ